jgi:hypothetical protein
MQLERERRNPSAHVGKMRAEFSLEENNQEEDFNDSTVSTLAAL